MDKFLVAMAGGIHIIRHQSHKVAEIVRLFSVTGCRTIQWEKPRTLDLQVQRNNQNTMNRDNNKDSSLSSKYEKGILDCCITSKFSCSNLMFFMLIIFCY